MTANNTDLSLKENIRESFNRMLPDNTDRRNKIRDVNVN